MSSDTPLPRQESISTQTPESGDLSCCRTCCIVTQGCLCHPNLKGLYQVLGFIGAFILYIGVCFGITTAIALSFESWHDYMYNGDFIMTMLTFLILTAILGGGYCLIKSCIGCWGEINHDVRSDLEQARSP